METAKQQTKQENKNKVDYSLNGLGIKIENMEKGTLQVTQVIQTMYSEILQYKQVTNYLIGKLMEKETYEEVKELSISNEEFETNFTPILIPYYANKEKNTIVKIIPFTDGWKYNGEKSDEKTMTFVYNNIELGKEVTVTGKDTQEVWVNLKQSIRTPLVLL